MKIKSWFLSQKEQYLRLWRVMKKPSVEELKLVSKVSAIGVLILGAIGFLINLLFSFLIRK